jgi:hypothetical protein
MPWSDITLERTTRERERERDRESESENESERDREIAIVPIRCMYDLTKAPRVEGRWLLWGWGWRGYNNYGMDTAAIWVWRFHPPHRTLLFASVGCRTHCQLILILYFMTYSMVFLFTYCLYERILQSYQMLWSSAILVSFFILHSRYLLLKIVSAFVRVFVFNMCVL